MSGWVGKFVSYAPTGAGEEDVRFQDIWLRAFQERGENGRFHMKMIRRADQEAKSWPRAGASCITVDSEQNLTSHTALGESCKGIMTERKSLGGLELVSEPADAIAHHEHHNVCANPMHTQVVTL